MSKDDINFRDPTAELRTAIGNLKTFTVQNKDSAIPLLINLDVQAGSLIDISPSIPKSAMESIRSFFAKLLPGHSREKPDQKREKVQQELIRSVDYLKTHYSIIEKLQEGDETQRKLAESASAVIKKYNALISQAKQNPPSLGQHIQRFFYEKRGMTLNRDLKGLTIEFTSPMAKYFVSAQAESLQHMQHKFSCHLHSANTLAASKKVIALCPHTPPPAPTIAAHVPTQQEEDAFRMKAITMLHKDIFSTPTREAFHSIRSAPIVSLLNAQESQGPDADITSLHLTISPFPGEVIRIKGSFQRTKNEKVGSIPIPESFQLSSHSTQTGFPHAKQYTGWALDNLLIARYPHHLDELPLFKPIYEKKQAIAHELLPQGSLINKGRELLKLKKKAIEEDLPLYLKLSRQATVALFAAAPAEYVNADYLDVIDKFYSCVKAQASPIDFLGQVHQSMTEKFIAIPHNALEEEWLEKGNRDIISDDHKQSRLTCLLIYNTALQSVEQQLKNQIAEAQGEELLTLNYILAMGQVIAPPSRAIILQQVSEKIGFAPPLLDIFERQIQAAVYKQLIAFHAELDWELQPDSLLNLEMARKHLIQQLESDIALFVDENSQELPMKIVDQLEVYYNQRHFQGRKG